MGTNNAIGNPLFFQEPPVRTVTFHHSWNDHSKWMGYFGGSINPHWPFTLSRMVFYPDFTNKVNKAEQYARSATGIQVSNTSPYSQKTRKHSLNQRAEKIQIEAQNAVY